MNHLRLKSALRSVVYPLGVVALIFGFGCALKTNQPPAFITDASTVGRVDINTYVTPTGQLLTPSGQQIELPGMRPQALAFSPDGKVIATSGKTNAVVLIDAVTGLILQQATLSTN